MSGTFVRAGQNGPGQTGQDGQAVVFVSPVDCFSPGFCSELPTVQVSVQRFAQKITKRWKVLRVAGTRRGFLELEPDAID
jgi:hypothetical protein